MRFSHWLLSAVGAAMVLAGCAGSDQPRTRLGALPFPGLFTLYSSSDSQSLGPHRYEDWARRPFEAPEGARGIVYTCRAGFLDLAHLREAIDWTRYGWAHSRALLAAGGGTHRFEHEGASFELAVREPASWSGLGPEERARAVDELALRIGARLAIEVETWHEIATWYGWRTVALVSEERSSFTCDDTSSHVVGALIGLRVLREGDDDFDRRAGLALRNMLDELGVVEREVVDRAARMVEGSWWRDGEPLRRDLDTGLEDGIKVPWVVAGVEECAGCAAAVLRVPPVGAQAAWDGSAVYDLTIAPSGGVASRLKSEAAVPVRERDLPRLIERVRAGMSARWGMGFDRPAPPVRTSIGPGPGG